MDFVAHLFSAFATPQGWIELVTLMFLEVALGIDNLVFIALTTERLAPEKRHLGRRLGLMGAMVMRCILLCFVTWFMSITAELFRLPFGVVDGTTPVTVRHLIFMAGGAYLVFKGISELREDFAAAAQPHAGGEGHAASRRIGLAHAVALIMVMDLVFSLDSVITAAGLSGHILVMCLAVICAVLIMIVFADPVSEFINGNPEIRVVALTFILLVGVLLLLEGFSVEEIGGVPLTPVLYCMMAFGLVVALLIMLRRKACERVLAGMGEGQGQAMEREER